MVPGGATRAASVRAGLAAVPPDARIVVVHDAARPLASAALFHAVVEALGDGAVGAVSALPVTDTIKTVEHGDLGCARGVAVRGTLERAELVAVQTPQAFCAAVLREAHAEATDATDDAALVEASGGGVRAVRGDPRNLKVTTAEDLAIAELLSRTEC